MKLEVFYDYNCPFCLQGHEYLLELLPAFPTVQVDWRPCEAHPRPERYGLHSDLCARGFYIAREQGADLAEYHRRIYQAALRDRLNIEDVAVLTDLLDGLLAGPVFREALLAGKYQAELAANNRAAWEEQRFAAVPSLLLGNRKLPSVPGLGLSREGLQEFLEAAAS